MRSGAGDIAEDDPHFVGGLDLLAQRRRFDRVAQRMRESLHGVWKGRDKARLHHGDLPVIREVDGQAAFTIGELDLHEMESPID